MSTVAIVKSAADLPVLAEGKVSNLYTDERGRLHVAPTAGGGGGGDASASKQDDAIAVLEDIKTAVELSASGGSTEAKQDEHSALLTTIDASTMYMVNNYPIGQLSKANSFSVALASDQDPITTADQYLSGAWDGDNTSLQIVRRMTVGATYAPNLYRNAGAANTANIKATKPAQIFSASCENKNVAARYIQIWDSATDATAGTLLCEFLVPPTSQIVIGSNFFSDNGLACTGDGLAWGFSSTSNTFTGAAAADCRVQITWL